MEQIGRYRILDELGRGATGIVYRAQDPAIGRVIAIKTIRLSDLTEESERERLRDRLFREAQSAGILSHPNIVTIYDMGDEQNLPYIAMELIEGESLEQIIARRRQRPHDFPSPIAIPGTCRSICPNISRATDFCTTMC